MDRGTAGDSMDMRYLQLRCVKRRGERVVWIAGRKPRQQSRDAYDMLARFHDTKWRSIIQNDLSRFCR